MRLLPYSATWALLLSASAAYAQKPLPATIPPLVNSGEAVKEGIALHDKDQFEAALAHYATVTPGDSLYAAVQGEMSLTYLAAKRYPEAIEAAQRALNLRYADPQPYITLGSAEDESKHPEKAVAAYQAGLKRFPYYQSLWYNLAVTQIGAKQFQPGLSSLQRSLELRPTHAGSHYALAKLAARQGQTSHAMLSLLTYLLIQPDSESSNSVLVELEKQASHAADIAETDRIPAFLPNEAFRELDLLLDSKVALRKDYTSKVKFDANLVKQLQLLVEKFPSTTASPDDLWLRLYGPLVEGLRQGENLTAATYFILSSADDKKAAQWVKGNKSKVDKMLEALSPAILRFREQQPLVREGKPTMLKGWFDDDARLQGIGAGTMQGEERHFTGPWMFLTNTGAIEEEGEYGPDFKRTGVWRSYGPNGQLTRTAPYVNGQVHGLVRDFHDNGQPSADMNFAQGKNEGEMKIYNYCGTLEEVRTFRQGLLEGPYTTFYSDGKPRLRVQMRADKQEGPQTTLYPNGVVEVEYTYVADKKQGPFLVNYPDKTPEKRGAYEQDELHGPYTEYFSNGQLMNTGTYTRGKRTGVWKEYFADGKLSSERTYDENGELHGTYHDYDYQGRLVSDNDYEHGRTTRQRYYNPATKATLLDNAIKKGRVAIATFNLDGISKGSGFYLNGQTDGEWRWTYANGQPQRVRHFQKGQLEGVAEDYYANGQLKSRTTYHNDEQEGAYESFYRDGQRYQTGYYRNGQPQGAWREYYADGSVREEYELHKGQRNGPNRSLAPNGKLTELRIYEFGRKMQTLTYDTLGRVVSDVQLQPGTKEVSFNHPGGKLRYRTAVSCYENQGPAAWFYSSGQPNATVSFVADKREGAFKSLYATGKTNLEGQFSNGDREGEWREYYPSGQLRSKTGYREGNLDGVTSTFYENGQPELEQHFLYGAAQGVARYYNPAGELLVEKLFERGDVVGFRDGRNPAASWQPIERMAGTIKTAFANGKPALDETIEAGQRAGTRTAYYSSGQVFRRMTFKDGLITGALTSYYPNGKLMEEEQYLHDERHGRCSYYRPDGTLERTETYRSGEQLGPTVYYNAKGQPTKTEIHWNQYVYEGK
ncbi:hypothetical protein J0X19_04645 [Hymenobacter sp. BT186]|uniref:Tetratricopeptide repeat protein n=1 Tax=Hymenobacter telluris TaxID=2816474 RepID=A0A939JCE6_9BACT|nr:toxin-antitoxin system YwqK family antitoxin [Hymenobacter telluris]MBO0357222.1 hypothetical protein [Hymenobacter telluris]MBW3373248.1 hypothetical protein [Hymenobacter norwichensis]